MSVSTRLEPAFVSVSPATTAESVLHLRNTGEIVDAYRFELVGAPAQWGVVEPAELSLYPGTSGTVVVAFSPPGGTEPEAGRYPFAVRAVPVERPDEVQVPEGVVEVLPAADLEAGLLARTRHGRLGARFQIAVRNAGNTTATIAAGAAEPDGNLRLRAKPGPEDFSPGEEGHFRIRARPRRPILKGRPRTHAFRVTVTLREVPRHDETEADGTDTDTDTAPTPTAATVPLPETAPAPEGESAPSPKTAPLPETVSKTVDAVFEQRPLLPAGAGKLLAAVVALAALGAVAWFALVKPAVTSAADTTASHVAASVAAQQASSNGPAGAVSQAGHPGSSTPSGSATTSPSKSPAPSGATTPTPTPKPTTPPATPPSVSKTSPTPAATTVTITVSPTVPGNPTSPKPTTTTTTTTTTANFDSALAVQVRPGQSGTAMFTTPARSTFMITDYVLENPQGDYGTIAVNVNGTQVSTLALENFRDDDYPWVTPLAVPAGAHVTITVNCGAPGTPPNVAPPTTCSESALFNGTMTTVAK